MLPTFPEFKKICIADKHILDRYCAAYSRYSDFAFSNIWAWDLGGKVSLSLLNNNLVIKFKEYGEDTEFFSFLGINKPNDTAEQLLRHSEQKLDTYFLNYIPEEIRLHLDTKRFLSIEERDNLDYIYSPLDIKLYEGSKFKSKRTAMHKFLRENPCSSVKRIDINDPKVQVLTRQIFQKHRSMRKDSDKSYYLDLEAKAFERTLGILDQTELIALGLFIENEMIGFSIDEILDEQFALSHFIKVFYTGTGAYEFFNNQTAKVLHDRGIREWNWVEDLGIENLRKSKLGYRPTMLLKQYKVTRRK